jgi:hypothetical protein
MREPFHPSNFQKTTTLSVTIFTSHIISHHNSTIRVTIYFHIFHTYVPFSYPFKAIIAIIILLYSDSRSYNYYSCRRPTDNEKSYFCRVIMMIVIIAATGGR